VNCFVPDNLIASITPLIVGGGVDPWTNTNFVEGDLTINGLAGNGSNKWLNTGLYPITVFSNYYQAGVTWYAYTTNSAASGMEWGVIYNEYINFRGTSNLGGADMRSYTGFSDYDFGGVWVNPSSGSGFYGNLGTGTYNWGQYFGNSSHPFALSKAGFYNRFAGGNPPQAIYVFSYNNPNGANPAGYTNSRLSFMAIHQDMSEADATNLFNLVQAMRVALGGGYV
jgi:hypothetical protein